MTELGLTDRPRPGGRSARVVSAVHQATFELLEQVGYDGLQLTDVAERAQVNKTTVYRRWPSKVELLSELLAALTQVEVATPDTGSLQQDLEQLLTDIATVLQNRAIRAILRGATEAAETTPLVRQAQTAFWEQRFRLSGAIVEKAIARGELPTGVPAKALLELAASPIYFRVLFIGEELTPTDVRELAARAVLAFRGVA